MWIILKILKMCLWANMTHQNCGFFSTHPSGKRVLSERLERAGPLLASGLERWLDHAYSGPIIYFFPLPFDPLWELTLGDALHQPVASCDAVRSFTWRLPNPFRGEEKPLVRLFALLLLRTCPVLIQRLHPRCCCFCCHGLHSSSSFPFLSPLNPRL